MKTVRSCFENGRIPVCGYCGTQVKPNGSGDFAPVMDIDGSDVVHSRCFQNHNGRKWGGKRAHTTKGWGGK